MYVAVDTETTGVDTEHDRPFCLSYCFESGAKDCKFEDPQLPRVLTNHLLHSYTPVFHNAKFDLKMLQNVGFDLPAEFEDTMLMGYILNEYHESQSLEHLVRRYLKRKKYSDPEFPAWIKANKQDIKENGYLNAPRELIEPYAIDDAVNTLLLFFYLHSALEKADLLEVYEFEKKVLLFLIELERTGLQVDVPYSFEHYQAAIDREAEYTSFFKDIGLENPNSHAQVRQAFNSSGYKISSTKKAVLEQLVAEGSKLAQKILEYRSVNTIRTRYIRGVLEKTEVETHRVYANFNQCATKTGRFSSSDPNFQNMPKNKTEKEFSEAGRGMFIPTPGYYFVGADYDQQEIRIIADETKDPTLLELLQGTGDVYVEIAKLMWPEEEITKDLRWIAKQTTLGMAYWMGAQRFVNQAAQFGQMISISKAKDIIDQFSSQFGLIVSRRDSLCSDVRKFGFVLDRYGRRYRIPRDLAYKALNAVVQGTAAGMMKRALLFLRDLITQKNLPMRIVNTIHDEILCEAERSFPQVDAAQVILYAMSESARPLFSLPITASPKFYGERWSETVSCKSWESMQHSTPLELPACLMGTSSTRQR